MQARLTDFRELTAREITGFDCNYINWWLMYLLWNCLRWLSLNVPDDKSTLVQVMAWCHQARSHYLSQCWLRAMLWYGIIMQQWVKPDQQEVGTELMSTINPFMGFCFGLWINWIGRCLTINVTVKWWMIIWWCNFHLCGYTYNLIHWHLGDTNVILDKSFSNCYQEYVSISSKNVNAAKCFW